MPTYLGPASALTLADGTVVTQGDECQLDDATQQALEDAGHQFSDTAERNAPQSASENLAEEGLTPEQAAANAGLSAAPGQGTPPPPTAPPSSPPPPPASKQ